MILRYYVIIFSIVFLKYLTSTETKELTERTSFDSFLSRFMYRSFRNLTLLTVGRTGRRTAGRFLQEQFDDDVEFPCDIRIGKSKESPQSVHKLKPGKCVVCAIDKKASLLSLNCLM